MENIERNNYLNKLINSLGNGNIKILTGIKGCGKSYLLNTLFFDYLVKEKHIKPKFIVKIGLLDKADLAKISENQPVSSKKFVSYLMKRCSNDGKYYVLLDDISSLYKIKASLIVS